MAVTTGTAGKGVGLGAKTNSNPAAVGAAKATNTIEDLNTKYSDNNRARQDAQLAADERINKPQTKVEGLNPTGIAQNIQGLKDTLGAITDPDVRYKTGIATNDMINTRSRIGATDAQNKFLGNTGMTPEQAEMWRGREFNKSVDESNNAGNRKAWEMNEEKRRYDQEYKGRPIAIAPATNSRVAFQSPATNSSAPGVPFAQQYFAMDRLNEDAKRAEIHLMNAQAAKMLYS